MLIGAEIFVGQIIDLSVSLGINATVLALIIARFATELPKEGNSVLWVRQGKLLSRSGRLLARQSFKRASQLPLALPLRRGRCGP